MPAENVKRRINSIAVGFGLIDSLVSANSPRSLTELSRAAGMPTSQAQLYMNSFVAKGIAEQNSATLKYQLGGYALQLGMTALNSVEPTELAHRKLIELTSKTGKNGHVSIWGNGGPVVISKVDQNRLTPLTIRIGHVLPVINSASGRVFWANLHRDLTKAVVKQELKLQKSEKALTRDKAEKLKTQIRKSRMAFTSGLHNVGFAAVASPVFDQTGVPVCTITILGPQSDFEGPELDRLSAMIVAAADELSSHLGWDLAQSVYQKLLN